MKIAEWLERSKELARQNAGQGKEYVIEVSEETPSSIDKKVRDAVGDDYEIKPELAKLIAETGGNKSALANLAIGLGGGEGLKVLDELIDVHCSTDLERAYFALYVAVNSEEQKIKKYAISLRALYFPQSLKALSLAKPLAISASKGEIDAAYIMQLNKECGLEALQQQ